jgi:CopG family nickel-responsive transcriptional regulator
MTLKRFGVSLEDNLLIELDTFVKENKFPNRSQAIRHLIEKNIIEKKWKCNNIVAGALVIVYDHHKREIDTRLNEIQHDYYNLILSSQHIHLSHDLCLETIALKGKAYQLTELSDKIIGIKGVLHGKLVITRAE